MKGQTPKSIDDYLSKVPADKRAALEKLRAAIHAAAPGSVECISYSMPAFRHQGKVIAYLGAAKNHCAFYPTSLPIEVHKDALKKYDVSKGTIRFAADDPLPVALVKKLVRTRIDANGKKTVRTKREQDGSAEVIEFLGKLKHPLKKEIEAVRKIILGVSPKIQDGTKWNSPSFRTTEWFGTLNLREDRVWLILHFGAKVKDKKNAKIADPKGLLKWLGKDRALVTFDDSHDVKAKRAALQAIVKQWIQFVE